MPDNAESFEEPIDDLSTADSLTNSHKAATDAYAHLVRATADICSPKYHYYCDDADAKLPEDMVIVANTRKIPIRDNTFLRIGSTEGALEAVPVPGKGPTDVQFVVPKGGRRALKQWKADIREDLSKIQSFCPEANYICLPEFGFPFGIEQSSTLEVPTSDGDWRWLQESAVLSSRFVCLGSAHRRYRRSSRSGALQYENVAVVYPSGRNKSQTPADVFLRRRNNLKGIHQVKGVTIKPQVERGISIHFDDTEVSANRQADLYAPACQAIDKTRYVHAKEAFNFIDTTAESSEPPVYIRKKSPARKLGEYIDASGKFELDVFVTELGVLAVLICYDAFDPSIFLSAVRMYYESRSGKGGFVHQAIDAFFIPAFNRSSKFVEMCKVLSRETNSVVIYVSGDDRCKTKSNVFVCGHSCDVWADSMGAEEETFYEMRHVPDFEHLHVYRINRQVINAAMRHLRVHASPGVRAGILLGGQRLGEEVL